MFMCHQREGLCGGWLACHEPRELLALRLWESRIDPTVFAYKTDVPVFSSGKEARAHGIRRISRPGAKAIKMIRGLLRQRRNKKSPGRSRG
jgi:uncharacterized protein DUF6283